MAYDAVKAHEYYMKYRKKGLKKGRKKGTKKAKTYSMLGVSASGLNSDGAIEAAAIKEKFKAEMNKKLAEAKTDEEKLEIRKQFSRQANAEIAKLKADAKYAKPKAAKKTKTSKAKTKSSSGSSGGSKRSSGSSTKSSSSSASTPKISTAQLKVINDIVTKISEMQAKIAEMSEEEKTKVKETINNILELLKKGKVSDGLRALTDSEKSSDAREETKKTVSKSV